jgi:hypothetical protein
LKKQDKQLEKEKVIFKYVYLKLKLKNPKLNLGKRGKNKIFNK